MMKKTPFIAKILIMVAILFVVVTIYNRIVERADNKYFSELNLNLKGEVLSVYVPQNFKGFGIVTIRILNTNLKYYDPRNMHAFYYCLIKDSIAQVYQRGARICSPGDIVEIDTKNRRFSLQSRTSGNKSWTIVLTHNSSFYRFVEKKYQSFFKI
jgi:hypothetical protein